MRKTKFSAGVRWRLKAEFVESRRQDGRRHPTWDFVVIGPPTYGSPKTHKLCRLEVPEHQPGRCDTYGCEHGLEQTYPHSHLKKYADHLEE